MIIFCFIGLITPLAALYFNGSLILMSALLFIGWSGTGSFPLFMGVIPGESVSRTLAASSMGLVVGVGELLGGTMGPTAAGMIADKTSLAAPVILIAACAGISGVLSLFLQETAPNKVPAAVAPMV